MQTYFIVELRDRGLVEVKRFLSKEKAVTFACRKTNRCGLTAEVYKGDTQIAYTENPWWGKPGVYVDTTRSYPNKNGGRYFRSRPINLKTSRLSTWKSST